MLVYDPKREAHCRLRLQNAPFVLDEKARISTLNAILSVCSHRKWTPYAVHIRTTHVHAVIQGRLRRNGCFPISRLFHTRFSLEHDGSTEAPLLGDSMEALDISGMK
jgi:hypothetical protein